MEMREYLCIDLKSFYASVECVSRGLDPMIANLVVADPERSEKTICLAVSSSLKKLGIPGRCRLFEIPKHIPFLIAPPRMQHYIDCAAEIYSIYLKYISKEDIHVYSIDEAFLDVTAYLPLYHMTARELGQHILDDIHKLLGIYATCGIGTNLYLAKIALDICAKHASDFIGELSEKTFQEMMWYHKPLTDFWRIGAGTAKKLAGYGIFTMHDIIEADEALLYRLFGIDTELLIDHAWGREIVTIPDIKAYRSSTHSITSGQVLMSDYSFERGRLIVKEMADLMCLDLVAQKLVTKSLTLHISYSSQINHASVHGSVSLNTETNADLIILPAFTALYERIADPAVPVRRLYLSCNHIVPEEYLQYSFFTDTEALERNRRIQHAVIDIKNKWGKNAILKGMNLESGAMTQQRNQQIGGHKSGCQTRI